MENSFPSFSRMVSARCGANGDTNNVSVSMVLVSRLSWSDNVFTKIINCDIAVLNLKFSMSSVTFFMVLWRSDSMSFAITQSGDAFWLSFSILSRNFLTPLTQAVLRATSFSNGHINISYVLNASAPYCAMTSSGLTTFHRLLDILRPSSASTSPTP